MLNVHIMLPHSPIKSHASRFDLVMLFAWYNGEELTTCFDNRQGRRVDLTNCQRFSFRAFVLVLSHDISKNQFTPNWCLELNLKRHRCFWSFGWLDTR